MGAHRRFDCSSRDVVQKFMGYVMAHSMCDCSLETWWHIEDVMALWRCCVSLEMWWRIEDVVAQWWLIFCTQYFLMRSRVRISHISQLINLENSQGSLRNTVKLL